MSIWALAPMMGLAIAQAEPLELSWTAPASCPSREHVVRSVQDRIPTRGGEQGTATELQADGAVRAEDGQFVLQLEIRGPSHRTQRTLRDPDCEAISDAAALILALAVMAETPTEPEPDEGEPPTHDEVPEPPREPAVRADAPPAKAEHAPPEEAPDRGFDLGARLGGGVGLGTLPEAGFDLELAPWLEWSRLRLEMLGRWQPARPARYAGMPDRGADVGRWAVGAQACFVAQTPRFAFPGCGGLEAGQMYGRGVGLPITRSARVPWASALASASAELALSTHVGLFLLARGGIALVRPRFVGETSGVVHQASRWNASALLGAFFRWPRRIPSYVSK